MKTYYEYYPHTNLQALGMLNRARDVMRTKLKANNYNETAEAQHILFIAAQNVSEELTETDLKIALLRYRSLA